MDINSKIFELYDYLNEHTEGGKASVHAITFVDQEWEKMPEKKMQDDDRTLLALEMIGGALDNNDRTLAEKWADIYLLNEDYKPTICFQKGRIAFHFKEYQTAFNYFKEAQDLSNNRELKGQDKFLDLLKNPNKYFSN